MHPLRPQRWIALALPLRAGGCSDDWTGGDWTGTEAEALAAEEEEEATEEEANGDSEAGSKAETEAALEPGLAWPWPWLSHSRLPCSYSSAKLNHF